MPPSEASPSVFSEAVPPLTPRQALVEAERCLYCFDAPCATACPTHIDVPKFIRRIAEGNLRGAAQTILEANPLGGMCARVCPTEDLCEGACVRNALDAVPVAIGRRQRHATDAVQGASDAGLFHRVPATGLRIAIVGAGPAGLACAHVLARAGHEVVLHDARPKLGGLNEYGLAAYKTVDDFAQREIAWLLGVAGIQAVAGWRLESAEQFATLRRDFDAVFLALGLDSTHALGLPGEGASGVRDAVDFIAELRQAPASAARSVGRNVVVIGGGMTAVDAAVQARMLGAEVVHLVYRRGAEQMSASRAEQEWAQVQGVTLRHWLAPEGLEVEAGKVRGVRFARQTLVDDRLVATGETETLPADLVLTAIGQTTGNAWLRDSGLILSGGRIQTDADGQTNLARVWAGGDCRAGDRDLTVQAVEHGKQAAASIHAALTDAMQAAA